MLITNYIRQYIEMPLTYTTTNNGRMCNQIFRNVAVSIIAKKFDLNVDYANLDQVHKRLGIYVNVGSKSYDNFIELNDNNYFDILFRDELSSNLDPNNAYFQTKDISNLIYHYLREDFVKQCVNVKNPFRDRHNNNNDLFIHIRLDDIAFDDKNCGEDYYFKAISMVGNFDRMAIASDNTEHDIIKKILKKYPQAELITYNDIKTIQLGSTFKNIILSHGTYSALIGYLAYYSNVYYPDYNRAKEIWFGDVFSIEGWHKV